MDAPQINTPPTQPEQPKKKRRIFRKLILWTMGILGLGVIGFAGYVYFYPVPSHEIFNYVPKDAIFVLEADDPIENWKTFSGTKIWRHLKKNEVFGDIEADADYLDTLIRDNSTIFSLISGKKLLISACMTKPDDYDFVYVMDLGKGAKIQVVLDVFKGVLKEFGLPFAKKPLEGRDVYFIGDPGDEVLLTFDGNIMLCSFNQKLLIDHLNATTASSWAMNSHFVKLREDAFRLGSSSSLMKFHLNFAKLDDFAKVFMDDVGTLGSISKMLDFGALDFKMKDEFAEMAGYVSVDTNQQSMANVLLQVSTGQVRAHDVLPHSTSFLLTIDFDDFATYYEKIAEIMKDDAGYQEYEQTQKTIGKLLGVSKSDKKIEKKKKRGKDVDYFDWIGEEIALAMMPLDVYGTRQAYLALFHIPDRENAEHDLREIEKKIRSRTPVKFKEYDYKGKTISYLALKGFFKLFFGKLFNKFDQPKYAILDEFVVFSNDTLAIHNVIDVVNGDKPNLPNDPAYRSFFKNFDQSSNYYIYVNSHNLYPFLPSLLSAESAAGIRKNEKYVTCFPRSGMQLSAQDGRFKAKVYLEFDDTPRKQPEPELIGPVMDSTMMM